MKLFGVVIMIPFSILTLNEGFNPVIRNSTKEVQAAILVLLDQKATSRLSYYKAGETKDTADIRVNKTYQYLNISNPIKQLHPL